jgi:hypothetical protein
VGILFAPDHGSSEVDLLTISPPLDKVQISSDPLPLPKLNVEGVEIGVYYAKQPRKSFALKNQ